MTKRVVKIKVAEEHERLIGTPEHNAYVASGMNLHKRTTVAPEALLQPLSAPKLKEQVTRQKEIEPILRRVLGSPFFSAPGFILYQKDCLSSLRSLEATPLRANLTLTSPPYNIGKEYEREMTVDAYVGWCSEWMNAIHQITHDRGTFWLNLGYFEVPDTGLCVPIPYLLWNKSPFYLLQEVVWTYGAGVATKTRLSPRNEKWLYYIRDPEAYTFNLDEIRDRNVKYPNQKKNGRYRCNPLGKNPSDVWEFPKVTAGSMRSSKERTDHPAQFPLAVAERIVRASSNPLDLVKDPFAGSCSTGIAAAGLGRIFVGFEIRGDYCCLAADRFESFMSERENSTRQSLLL
jgi:adenine-specific DNA-methyltransferase